MKLPFSRFFKNEPDRIPQGVIGAGEVGWAETKLYVDNIPKYNPDDLIGRKGSGIYRKMLLDEQVKAVTRFKRDAITSREILFEMPNVAGETDEPGSEGHRRIEIYEEMVRKTKGSFIDGLNAILMAMHQGFSITEKLIDTFDYEGRPYLGVKKLIAKPYETFEFDVDRYGAIKKIVQRIDNEEQTIDLSRFVYYVQNPEYDRHYGQSDLREAYRSWYSKDVIIRFYNMFLERFAGGFVVASPKGNSQLAPGSRDYNAVKAAIESIQGKTSLLLPGNIDLDVNNPATTDQFERAISLHDLQIAKALLVPNLLGITPQASQQGGGFAQANTQLEAFLWTLDADAHRLEEVVNEQIFEPLSQLNFADGIGPRFRFKAVSDTKKMEIVKTWKELVVGAAVEASDTDEHHLREMLNFPHKGEPLDLNPKIGEPTAVPPQSRDRGPVKEPNQKRVRASREVFSMAARRVAFTVIERAADRIEDEGVDRVESRIADMVSAMSLRVREESLGTNAAGPEGIEKVDFDTKLKTKSKRALFGILKQAWDLGIKHATTEISSARRETFKVNMGRIDDNAAEFLNAAAFTAFSTLSDDMRAIVQRVLVNGIKFSWTTDEIVQKIYDTLTKAGFIYAKTNADVTARSIDDIREAIGQAIGDPYRVRTMVRTNAFEAINEARFSTFTDPQLDGFVEALEYSAILDSRTTDICRHLDDRVYPADSLEWNKYRPPNHFNCRSLLVPVTIIDTDVIGKDNDDGRWSRTPRIEPQVGFGGETG